MPVILTLQVPKGGQAIPAATTARPEALRHFKTVILEEWEAKVEQATDEVEAMLARLELQRLRRALAALIPGAEDDKHGTRQG